MRGAALCPVVALCVWFVLCSCATACDAPNSTYTIRMTDAFGDGWTGVTLDVFDCEGPTLLAGGITLASGAVGNATVCLPAFDGVFGRLSGGRFLFDTAYTMYTASGQVVLEGSGTSAAIAAFNCTVPSFSSSRTHSPSPSPSPVVVCDGPELKLHMTDGYGDGWSGNTFSLFSCNGTLLASATLSQGSAGIETLCPVGLASLNFRIEVAGGSYPEEVGWTLLFGSQTIATGGAPLVSYVNCSLECEEGFEPWIVELSNTANDPAGWPDTTITVTDCNDNPVTPPLTLDGSAFAVERLCVPRHDGYGVFPQPLAPGDVGWLIRRDGDVYMEGNAEFDQFENCSLVCGWEVDLGGENFDLGWEGSVLSLLTCNNTLVAPSITLFGAPRKEKFRVLDPLPAEGFRVEVTTGTFPAVVSWTISYCGEPLAHGGAPFVGGFNCSGNATEGNLSPTSILLFGVDYPVVHTTSVRRFYLDLVGTIPPEVHLLPLMEVLNLSENELTGTLPSQIGLLKLLNDIDVFGNRLSGPVPSELALATSLRSINFAQNFFNGTLPTQLAQLPELHTLYLYQNQFSGTIPVVLGQLPILNIMMVQYNNFEGTIPVGLFAHNRIADLEAGYNNLVGTIPTQIARTVDLKALYLQENGHTGTLPTELALVTTLRDLDLHSNQLSGSIPSQLGLLIRMQHLHLHGNALTSSVPSQLGLLQDLVTFRASQNKLSGTLPTQLATLQKLRKFMVYSNALEGAVDWITDEWLQSATLVWLHDNFFVGCTSSDLSSDVASGLSLKWEINCMTTCNAVSQQRTSAECMVPRLARRPDATSASPAAVFQFAPAVATFDAAALGTLSWGWTLSTGNTVVQSGFPDVANNTVALDGLADGVWQFSVRLWVNLFKSCGQDLAAFNDLPVECSGNQCCYDEDGYAWNGNEECLECSYDDIAGLAVDYSWTVDTERPQARVQLLNAADESLANVVLDPRAVFALSVSEHPTTFDPATQLTATGCAAVNVTSVSDGAFQVSCALAEGASASLVVAEAVFTDSAGNPNLPSAQETATRACPAGSAISGHGTCVACAPGTYADVPGLLECKVCTICNTTVQTVVHACNATTNARCAPDTTPPQASVCVGSGRDGAQTVYPDDNVNVRVDVSEPLRATPTLRCGDRGTVVELDGVGTEYIGSWVLPSAQSDGPLRCVVSGLVDLSGNVGPDAVGPLEEGESCVVVVRHLTLSNSTVTLVWALDGVALFLVFATALALYRLRKHPTIRASTPSLSFLILFSLALAVAVDVLEAIPLTDAPTRTKEAACAVAIHCFFYSIALFLASLFARNYRILRIFDNPGLRDVNIRNSTLFEIVGGVLGANVVAMVAWNIWGGVELVPRFKFYSCDYGSKGFLFIAAGINAIVLCMCVVIIAKIFRARVHEKFNETKAIAFCFYNGLLVFVLYWVLRSSMHEPKTFLALSTFCRMYFVVCTLLVLFWTSKFLPSVPSRESHSSHSPVGSAGVSPRNFTASSPRNFAGPFAVWRRNDAPSSVAPSVAS